MDSKVSVLQAVTGSHTVFLVTTPDFTGGESKELVHGKNVTDACQETGVQHLIFSSLLHVTDTTNGRLTHVPHFDMKAEVERYIRSKDIPSTFVLPGYFMSNYTALQLIRKGDNGEYTLAYPVGDKAMFPLIDIEADMGKFPRNGFNEIAANLFTLFKENMLLLQLRSEKMSWASRFLRQLTTIRRRVCLQNLKRLLVEKRILSSSMLTPLKAFSRRQWMWRC